MKSKATGCGSMSTVFSSIVLLCVSSIVIAKQEKEVQLTRLPDNMDKVGQYVFKIAFESIFVKRVQVQSLVSNF